MRAALYPRVSTDKQEREGYSIGEQIERMNDFCRAKGWHVHKTYTDAGFSGATTERPGLQRMLHDAEHHQFDVVVVYKLDRLSRSQKDTLSIIQEQLLPNRVDFVSVLESFLDTSTPYGIAMIGILAVFAELERSNFAVRTSIGREGRAKAGKWHGGVTPPIGYRYINGELVIDDYEAMQIREFFRLHNMRIAPMSIQQILNEKGYRTSYGKWNRKETAPIIMNRVYIGEVSYSGKWYPGTHDPIIEREVFDKAQRILGERLESHRRKPKYNSPIAGLVQCGWCKNNYYVNKTYSGNKKYTYRNFTCYARSCYHGDWGKIPRDKRCKNKNWKVDELEQLIMDDIKTLALNPEHFDTSNKPDDNDAVQAITERLAAIDARLDRLLDLYDSGTFDMNKVEAKAAPLNEEKMELLHQLKQLQAAEVKITKTEAVQIARTLEDVLPTASEDDIRAMVHELIDCIVIDGDDVHVYWRF